MTAAKFYIGCQVWSCPAWSGSVYPQRAAQNRWLHYYSQTFNTVEGNSTFYATPTSDTLRRWAEQTEDGFRFALKFPKSITHEKCLHHVEAETEFLLEGLMVLKEHQRLGPTFLQFSDRFGPENLERLGRYLENLPRVFPWAVEVRHPGFFQGKAEKELHALLVEQNIDRVIFDSRPLYSAPPSDESELKSQGRKPRVPVSHEITGSNPFLRLVGRNDVTAVDPWIDEWVPTILQWIQQGKTPYLLLHAPDYQYSPEFVQRFYARLAQAMPELEPEFAFPNRADQQLRLF